MVKISVWNKTQTLEIKHNVAGTQAYSIIMPMHISDDDKHWHPKEYVPEKVEEKK